METLLVYGIQGAEIIRASVLLQVLTIAVMIIVVSKLVVPLIIFFLRFLTAKTSTDIDDSIITEVRTPLFYSLVLCGLGVSVSILSLGEDTAQTVLRTIQTLFVFVWISPLIRIARIIFTSAAASKKTDFISTQTLPIFDNLSLLIIIAGAIYGLFSIWGINMTAWLASAGVIGMAVAFAAKDTLANLIAGIFILADKPYKVGDFIVLDSGERGKVTNVGVRSTRVLTRGDSEIIIPNSVMGGKKITNETGGPDEKFRITVNIGVAYGSDIDRVEKILMEIGTQEELVCADPEPRVRFIQFGASSLDYALHCWVAEPVLRGKALHFLNRAVYKRFAEEGIEIPFPQMDVHLDK